MAHIVKLYLRIQLYLSAVIKTKLSSVVITAAYKC